MVLWLRGIQQYLHALLVQRSLNVLRPNQAFHDIVIKCGCRIRCLRFFRLAYRPCMYRSRVTGEVLLTPGAVISKLVSLKDFRCKGINRCRRCPVSIDLYAIRKASRYLFFCPPKLGDPPPTTSELIIAPLYHSPLLQSPSLRSTQLWPIDRCPVVL